MVLRTDDVSTEYTVRWMSVNGHTGWFAVWLDGTTLPLISGGEGGAGGSGGGSGSEDSDSDDNDDDDSDDDEDDEDDGDDTDDDKKKSSKSKSSEATDSEKKRLSEEAKRHRLRAKTNRERAEKAEKELNDLKGKDLKESEKLTVERDALKEYKASTEPIVSELRMFKSFVTEAADAKLAFEDPEEALLLISAKKKYKDLIEIDDDGEISGMDEAVKALAKDKPRLLVTASGKDESDDDDDDSDDASSNGRKSANRSVGSKKRKAGQLDQKALEAKYPALRR